MIVLYICVGISVFQGFVDCDMIANNTISITINSPLGGGMWQISGSCYVTFTESYTANTAWMVARFGVSVTNYQDFAAGGFTHIDPDGKWVVSRIGYGSGGGTLTFAFMFEFDLWLAGADPSGECSQFLDENEALNFANGAPVLSDPPANTLIGTDQLVIDSSGHSGHQGLCQFVFTDIRVGAREAMVLVSFTVPVEYQSDYIGNTVIDQADDKSWYLVQDDYAHQHYADYRVNFDFLTANEDISSAFCSMYVSEADALTAANSIGVAITTGGATSGVLTTTSIAPGVTTNSGTTPGVTIPPTPVTVSGTSSSVPATMVTTNPAGTATPVIIPHTTRSNATTGSLVESYEMRNKYVYENSLWQKTGVSLVHCGRLCLADIKCVSVFHHEGNVTCTGHQVVYGSGNSVPGVIYYVLT